LTGRSHCRGVSVALRRVSTVFAIARPSRCGRPASRCWSPSLWYRPIGRRPQSYSPASNPRATRTAPPQSHHSWATTVGLCPVSLRGGVDRGGVPERGNRSLLGSVLPAGEGLKRTSHPPDERSNRA
jgi:hypothetical protein